MEIELKYTLRDEQVLEALWKDPWLREQAQEESLATEDFDALYYDTEDCRLLGQGIAYRVRQEGRHKVACLKWSGQAVGALHEREELNLTLPENWEGLRPDPAVFSESDIGARLLELLGDSPLQVLMEVEMQRRSFKIDTGGSLQEIALDSGKIRAGGREDPICELELELYSGPREELLRVGKELEEAYGLVPEERSKFHRGLALLGIGG